LRQLIVMLPRRLSGLEQILWPTRVQVPGETAEGRVEADGTMLRCEAAAWCIARRALVDALIAQKTRESELPQKSTNTLEGDLSLLKVQCDVTFHPPLPAPPPASLSCVRERVTGGESNMW
jgi:hypothetical protein